MQAGTSLYPIFIKRESSEIEFSYLDGKKLIYIKLSMGSSPVTNKIYSNYIHSGHKVNGRMVWQETINSSGNSGQVLISYGTQVGHRTYSNKVS